LIGQKQLYIDDFTIAITPKTIKDEVEGDDGDLAAAAANAGKKKGKKRPQPEEVVDLDEWEILLSWWYCYCCMYLIHSKTKLLKKL